MLPTFNARGDVLLTEYVSPRFHWIRSGDVVVAVKPTDPRVSVLKRVRGMAGEKIWVHPRSERYPILYTVPNGYVWLEGDNASQSTDSREYGPVPLSLIRGRVILRFWPLTQAGFVKSRVIDHTVESRQNVWSASPVQVVEAECQQQEPQPHQQRTKTKKPYTTRDR